MNSVVELNNAPRAYFVIAVAVDSTALEFLGPSVHHHIVVVLPEQRAVVVIDLPQNVRAFTSRSRHRLFAMQKNGVCFWSGQMPNLLRATVIADEIVPEDVSESHLSAGFAVKHLRSRGGGRFREWYDCGQPCVPGT